MKEHLYGFAKDDYVAFITEYVRRTAGQYGPAPPDDVQRKLVRGGHKRASSPQLLLAQLPCERFGFPSSPRLAHGRACFGSLTGLFVWRQAALQLSQGQGLALVALTRTMITQLGTLSQRFKALDDVGQSSSAADSPPPDVGRRAQHRPAACGAGNPDEPDRPALSRSSPELAALRVSAVSETLYAVQSCYLVDEVVRWNGRFPNRSEANITTASQQLTAWHHGSSPAAPNEVFGWIMP